MYTDDLGKYWTEVTVQLPLKSRFENSEGENRPITISDSSPMWHKLLGVGHTVVYTPERKVVTKPSRNMAYSYYDPKIDQWQESKKMELPDCVQIIKSSAG